jgi:hypothetical protein|tara:strand:+ start:277 stop:504 length:228 start_codon:yes stop_codon:yes gene_type:complete
MYKKQSSKTKVFTSSKTVKNKDSVCEKREQKDTYFQLRMNKEWKDKVKLISEMNDVSLSHFIRTSIEKNIQTLSR